MRPAFDALPDAVATLLTSNDAARRSLQPGPSRTTEPPLLSVVVPVRNEAPNVAPLIAEIEAALAPFAFEILYVDDGSSDDTPEALRAAAAGGAPLRSLRHRTRCGQSAAIITGVKAARGSWIATLDGDGQNDPADIPRLLQLALDSAGLGSPVLVTGHRVSRRDSRTKRLTSWIANAVRSRLLGDATPDTGCGLKVFPRSLFLELPHFDHMHRFLPALVLRQGGRVLSEPVSHRPRRAGRSNYGTFDRLTVSLFDLIGVAWLQRRWQRPEVLPEDG
jgi:dolichol-phosphate mannosyltransferase